MTLLYFFSSDVIYFSQKQPNKVTYQGYLIKYNIYNTYLMIIE